MMSVDVTPGAAFQASLARPLFKTGIVANPVIDQFVVTSDAQRFLVNIPARQDLSPPITVMLNWAAVLKK